MSEASRELERLPSPDVVPALAYQPAAILSDDEITRVWRIASALAQSGMHETAKSAGEAFAKILLGRDLGLSAMQSLMSIDFVKGSPQIRGVTLLSFIRKHPNYEYEIVEHTEEKAVLRFFKDRGDGQGLVEFATEEFNVEMATTAKLLPADPRSPWNTARKNMLLWRCASNGVKFNCPDLLGGVPVYTEGDTFGLESRDGGVEEIGAGADSQQSNKDVISTLLVDKALRRELFAAIEEANEHHPGTWLPARTQMVFTAQPETYVRAELERIREGNAKARVPAEVSQSPDAEDAPAPDEVVDAVAVDEEDHNPVCPVCERNWLDHTEEQKDACQATADAETA